MPFNGSGTFVRTQNWTNDANNNLPISATKFDNEDNDFAGGLSLCLTRDGQGKPTTPLTWSQPLTINLAADGAPAAWGRTGGVNNPQLQANVTDASGAVLNLTTAQSLALAIQGTNVITVTATSVTIAQPLTAALQLANGTVGAPALAFASETNSGLYRVGAGDLGLAVLGAETLDIQTGQLAVLGAAAAPSTLSIAGNGVSIANGFQIIYGAAGGVTFKLGGTAFATLAAGGAWALSAPTSGGPTLSVAAAATQYIAIFTGSGTSGQSFGFQTQAGTSAADVCAAFNNAGNTQNYLYVRGNGEVYCMVPAAASAPPSGCFQVGYLDEPQNNVQVSYTLAITDRGKQLYLTSGSNGHVTIPANSSVAFPIGTIIRIINFSPTAWTIPITTDTLSWLPSGATGTRTLAVNGACSLEKVTATSWVITGVGLS